MVYLGAHETSTTRDGLGEVSMEGYALRCGVVRDNGDWVVSAWLPFWECPVREPASRHWRGAINVRTLAV